MQAEMLLEHAEEAELHLAGGQVSTAGAVAAAFPLAVALHRLGDYSLKGVEEPVKVVQFLPLLLEGRLEQFVAPAIGGKVRPREHGHAACGLLYDGVKWWCGLGWWLACKHGWTLEDHQIDRED